MKRRNLIWLIITLILITVLVDTFLIVNNRNKQTTTDNLYNPVINPSDFSSNINNKYLSLTPGKKMVYEANTEDGLETIEVYVMNEKMNVLGVDTVVVWDRVWLDGELVEDTKDWYAQDKEGNVWYFGEESYEMLDGKIVSTAGSWKSGVDGAKPGIIMKKNPVIGDSYRQEYYKGEAEDMADIIALSQTVNTPYGNFKDCIQTYDYTPLDISSKEHKYYCSEVGGIVLEINLDGGERLELVGVDYNVEPTFSKSESNPERLTTEITEDEAKEIALQEVSGRVTGIEIERKYGKTVYVVQIDADIGPETDVVIDISTGEVLGVEI